MASLNSSRAGGAAAGLGGGCAFLFGSIFILAGLAVGFFLYFPAVSDWWRARDWEETPCIIESAELRTSHGKNGPTYSVAATYRYEFRGHSHQTDRVSLFGGSDNMGDFQQNAYHELDTARHQQRPFRCYVNPDQPAEAVLYRDLRWGMLVLFSLFPTLFPLAGGFVAFGGLSMSRTLRKSMRLREQHPDQPWKWKPEWAGDAITPAGDALIAFIAAGGWILLVQGPLVAAIFISGVFSETWLALLACLPALLGLLPLRAAWRRYRTRQTTGALALRLRQSPLQPGGVLEGTLHFGRALSPLIPITLTARCIRKVTTGSGKSRTTSQQTLWEHTQSLHGAEAQRDDRGCSLPIRLELPADMPSTDTAALIALAADEREHFWQIEVQTGPGTNSRILPLPVFGEAITPADSPAADEAAETTLEARTQQIESRLKARGIEARFNPDGLPEFILCPPGRHRGTAIFLIAFGGLWLGAFALMLAKGAPFLFKLIWGLSAPAIELYGLYLLIHQRRIEFGGGAMRILNQAGPFYSRTDTLEPRHVVEFTHDNYMRSGNEHIYRVRAVTTFGKKITLVDGLTEEATAQQLAARLLQWKTAAE